MLANFGGGLKLSGCVRDSISAFLAASAPKKLVFMVDGETQRIFIFIFWFPFPICWFGCLVLLLFSCLLFFLVTGLL